MLGSGARDPPQAEEPLVDGGDVPSQVDDEDPLGRGRDGRLPAGDRVLEAPDALPQLGHVRAAADQPDRGPGRTPIRLVGSSSDVTDMKESVRKLKHRTISRWEATIDATAEGDPRGRPARDMSAVNQRFLNMWGHPDPRGPPRGLEPVLDPAQRDPESFLERIREESTPLQSREASTSSASGTVGRSSAESIPQRARRNRRKGVEPQGCH